MFGARLGLLLSCSCCNNSSSTRFLSSSMSHLTYAAKASFFSSHRESAQSDCSSLMWIFFGMSKKSFLFLKFGYQKKSPSRRRGAKLTGAIGKTEQNGNHAASLDFVGVRKYCQSKSGNNSSQVTAPFVARSMAMHLSGDTGRNPATH